MHPTTIHTDTGLSSALTAKGEKKVEVTTTEKKEPFNPNEVRAEIIIVDKWPYPI